MIDHISLPTNDMTTTRAFYEGVLGFPVILHETICIKEGGYVDHQFFDCGNGCSLAFMQWCNVSTTIDALKPGFSTSFGYPPGTFHFAFRCNSMDALETRRNNLVERGIKVSQILDLNPYHSFFLDDPNGYRLEFTVRVGECSMNDLDPQKRKVYLSLQDFESPTCA